MFYLFPLIVQNTFSLTPTYILKVHVHLCKKGSKLFRPKEGNKWPFKHLNLRLSFCFYLSLLEKLRLVRWWLKDGNFWRVFLNGIK